MWFRLFLGFLFLWLSCFSRIFVFFVFSGVFFVLFYLTFLGVFKAFDCEDLGNLGVMFGRLRFVGWLFRLALCYVGFVGWIKVWVF